MKRLAVRCAAWVLVWCGWGGVVAAGGADVERPGPSSRRTGVAITEIMDRPAPRGDGRKLEYVELFNSQIISEDLSDHRLEGDLHYSFPAGTVLAPGAYLVVAPEPEDVRAVYGITNVVGPARLRAGRESRRLRLLNELGAVMLEIEDWRASPWPIAADGTGHSMVLLRPSYGEADARAWGPSDRMGGSPGRADPVSADPLDGVCINEVCADAEGALGSFVEFYNRGGQAVNLEGAWVTDGTLARRFRIPARTVVGARGHLACTSKDLGFELDAGVARIFLMNPTESRVVDALELGGCEAGVSVGRFPDGAADVYRLGARSAGGRNPAVQWSPVVINEIMYHPITGQDDDQYVELHNRTREPVDLGGWRMAGGIEFAFPAGQVLPPGGYVVVAKDAARLGSSHPTLTASNCLGNFKGALSRGGERVALTRPLLGSSAPGRHVVVDEVTYGDGGRWGHWSDGGGSSLERIDPEANGRLAGNWADSDETRKSAWTVVEYQGPIGETLGTNANTSAHLYLLGEGECLVDDVEVVSGRGGNVVANGRFESGLEGWVARGAFDQSTVESGGPDGGLSLRVRAGSRGDTGMNKIRSLAFPALPREFPVRLRCRARWLRGWPELLMRLQGGGAEAFGRLDVPRSLGTPGAPNSALRRNAGPALWNVRHAPVLPRAGQNVLITVQADDPQGLGLVVLRYRIDPSMTMSESGMRDDGADGDAVAGDGVYSATLPGQPAGTLAAFHVLAVDLRGASNTFPRVVFPEEGGSRMFPSDAASRECLVRFGERELPGEVAGYRLWVTRANRDRWAVRDSLNNADLDATFVYRGERAIYNAGVLFSGSSWHTSQMATGPDGANRCDYVVRLPADDFLLGETDLNLVLPGFSDGPNGSDLSGMSEQIGALLFRKMGVHTLHRRYIHLFVNGSQRSVVSGLAGDFVCEDVQQPNGRVMDAWFPSAARGPLFKVEDWFEFDDDREPVFQIKDADLVRRTLADGVSFNVAPYRYMWRPRSVRAGESMNDYTALFRLIDAVSPGPDPGAPVDLGRVGHVADLEQWFRVIACQRMLGNSDSYGWERGKNSYLYRPGGGRFVLIPWDVDSTMGLGGEDPNSSIDGASDPRIVALMNHPEIRRSYRGIFREMLDGPLRPGFLEAAYDERMAAFRANGIGFDPGAVAIQKRFLSQRREGLARQLR